VGKQETINSHLPELSDEVSAAQRKLEQQRCDLGIVTPEPQTPPSIPVFQFPPSETPSGDCGPTPSKEAARPSPVPSPRLSSRKAEKILLIREMEVEKQLDLGCLARPLVRCQIPMTDPKSLPKGSSVPDLAGLSRGLWESV